MSLVSRTESPLNKAARPLLFLATIAGAMGALTEFPLRWFNRGGFVLAGLVAGAAWLVADRRASPRARQPLAAADFLHYFKAAGWLLLWCEVATLTVRFLRLNALPYFSWDPAVFQLLWDRRIIVISHIVAGLTALLLGPGQFWPAWRERALTVHRWLGRIYVVAVTVGAGAACYLSWFVAPYEGGKITGASMAALALAWLGATTIGWRKAVAGEIDAHREWMFRSYLLTLVFVSLRWPLSLPIIQRLGPFDHVVPVVVWMAGVVPLALAEVAIRRARAARELRFV